MKKGIDKTNSSYQRDINRHLETIEVYTAVMARQKQQLRLYSQMCKMLLKEGRITKEELKQYSPRKPKIK